VQRSYSDSAQTTAGLVGLLFCAAFGAMECKKCGKLKLSEFPTPVQAKIVFWSLVMVIGAIALLGFVLALLFHDQH
jgi:hypothetical protein